MTESDHNAILCLNCGSSSLKFALYLMGGTEEHLFATGAAERIGLKDGHFWIKDKDNRPLLTKNQDFVGHDKAVKAAFASLEALALPTPVAVGHRVVHGGPKRTERARIDAPLLDELKELTDLAPLHLPAAIQGIEAVTARFPGLVQVACFDTAFHRPMPELAQRFALPRAFWDSGIRRYGFHGLSYEYVLQLLGATTYDRLIIAHLGNGASMAAIKKGRPLDTTMGFTPAGGLMMGTRCGDLDPGVLIHMIRDKGYDIEELEHLVNHESGLVGVSGISSDMKTLLETDVPEADQAVAMFCYHARKHLGALAAAMGGLDALVFTGGIGERAASVRWEICRHLDYLGIRLDSKSNAAHADIISVPESNCTVHVVLTNEDLVIARQTYDLLAQL